MGIHHIMFSMILCISKFSFKHFGKQKHNKKLEWLFESLQLIAPNKSISSSSEIFNK